MIDEQALSRLQFVFRSSAVARPLTATLRFEANGRIGGYAHPNEYAWAWTGDRLQILTRDGRVSCAAERVAGEAGRLAFEGRFLLEGDARHRFEQAAPNGQQGGDDDVFSFDLFDTLIFRKCCEPREIFAELGRRIGMPGFAAARAAAEQVLWLSGDYDFDDIYRQLALDTGWERGFVDQLQRLELELEWHNICPITEMVRRVMPGDLIVSDMYLPAGFVRRIVVEKCGLTDSPIFLSSHGKHRGTIWDRIGQTHCVRRHYGDNLHGDIQTVRRRGLQAEHITLAHRTPGEQILNALGMRRVANVLREVRLTYFEPDPARYGACLAQLEVNIPLLIVASLALLRICADRGTDTLLMCSRDCNLWVHLMQQLAALGPTRPVVKYFTASRVLYLSGGENYRRYFDAVSGRSNLMVDVSGTGRSPAHFIAEQGLQDRCGIYLLAYSNAVLNFMNTMAPPRDDVDLVHLAPQTPFASRVTVECLNMSLENRTIGFARDAGALSPEVEPPEFSGLAAGLIAEMRQIFGITLGMLAELGAQDFAFDADPVLLRTAAEVLISQALRYHQVLAPIIDTVCNQESHVKDVILERCAQVPALT